MHVRRVSVVAAMLMLVLGLTGCARSAPEITYEQVEAWMAMGQEMVPSATAITVETDQAVNMVGGGSNSVWIEVSFANFADLKDNAKAVDDFEAAIEEQSGAWVETQLVNAGAEEFDEVVAALLVDKVPGAEGAFVESEVWTHTEDGVAQLEVDAFVYVSDEDVVDPAWLDAVSDNAQQAITDEGGGSIKRITVLPARVLELGPEGAHIEQSRLWVWDLPGVKDVAAGNDCVRTSSWAYDVSHPWAAVSPASEPRGACGPVIQEE